jgi:hypothetical protein
MFELRSTRWPLSVPARALAVRAGAVVFGGLLAVELLLRALGAIDLPLYVLDDAVRYQYRPAQTGVFLNRNHWAVNERSMPTSRAWRPGVVPDVLLIGNSIVAGGNPYDQSEKLAPLMERAASTRLAVWPVATGGWSTVNELAYLETHPDVVASADFFVWSHVEGGLGGAAPWLGDRLFPHRPPRSALVFVFQRYAAPRLGLAGADGLGGEAVYAPSAPDPAAYARHLERFERTVAALARASGRRTPGVLLLYPTLEQLSAARRGVEWLPERTDLERVAAAHGVWIVDLTRFPEWTDRLYKDGIHPTANGNAVLARILLTTVYRALEE